ncbi:Rha family transcriptional regulator [Neisseriaceae bacterium ESL0693]|nr:Rha family transcriptional regulator [Neisseriaceae bacterium ESL0693]
MVLVPIAHGQELKTDSLKVAKSLDKHHDHVVRDIENFITQISEKFSQTIFGWAGYIDKQAKPRKMYETTKDGFMLLVENKIIFVPWSIAQGDKWERTWPIKL